MSGDRSKDQARDERRQSNDKQKKAPRDLNYSEESHKDTYVVDTLKPPTRPGGGKGDGGRY